MTSGMPLVPDAPQECVAALPRAVPALLSRGWPVAPRPHLRMKDAGR